MLRRWKRVTRERRRLPRDLLAQARAQAGEERLLACLERLSGDTPITFTQRLATTLHYPVLATQALFACVPAFERVSLAQCLKREFALVEYEGQQVGVFADPFDSARLAWIDDCLQGLPLFWPTPPTWPRFSPAMKRASTLSTRWSTRSRPAARATLAEAVADQHQRRPEPGGQAGQLDALRRPQATRQRYPPGHDRPGPGDQVPHRRRAQRRRQGQRQRVRRTGDLADQGHGRAGHRRKRVPQDGRFKVAIGERQIDFRVSIMPSIFGEDAVLRVLDKQELSNQVSGVQLQALGFEAHTLRALRRLAAEPYGMILVTGPTGSGKTTTLYAMLSEINHGVDKIITIEDPVEYQLPGVLQIPVNEKKGLTFARGLRSILRHDPDKIWSARSATRTPRRSPCSRRSPGTWCSPPSTPTTSSM